jgi:uncharacterized repeat protein (TIGR01451 family)
MRNCLIKDTYRAWYGSPLFSLVWLMVFGLVMAASAAERQHLNGRHVPTAVDRLAPVGDLPGSQRLNLAIGLPLRNQPELESLLQQLYDPASPNYRRYLTPGQFTEQFGPTEQDYQAVMEFAKANGLTVTFTHPNRLVLDVTGTATDIAKAFQLTMRVYQHPTEARTFYAPDVEPTVDLAIPILHISGLDNYALPHPNSVQRPAIAAANATVSAGSGPSGSYQGSDFQTAYVPGTALTGAGQTVGLLQFDGFYANDITTYETQTGLPNVPLTVVPIDGGVSTPGSGVGEVSLDIEMVISMAPGISRIYVYEAPNPSPWVDLLSRMANDNLSKQLSCSWGGGGPDPTSEQVFKQMAAQGQSFFNATGDSDAFTGSLSFPSDSPNITEVGGTTLTTGSGASYSSETVWNWGLHNGSYVGSSGGISTYYAIPAYQQGLNMSASQGSTTMRNVPDVALTADNVYVVYGSGSTGFFGGTSCAAPLWAGFTALMNQQAVATGQPTVGFLNPAIYALGKSASYASCFHDTTAGNNFWPSSPSRFSAVTGYDLCTGWGTPNGVNLINALTAPPVPMPFIVSNSFTLVAEGCPNGVIDPAETVTVTFGLQNTGTADTTNLVATLLTTGGILSPSGPQTYGVVSANGTAVALPFSFTASGNCGGTNTATLQLQDGTANLGTLTFSFPLGQFTVTSVFSQNFDGVTAPALPAGWATSTSGGESAWVTTTSARDTAPNSVFSPDPASVGVNELDSPAIGLPAGSAQLTFRHNYNLQSSRDGGVLEIKIGGGAWTDIQAAGGSFVSGGYVAVLGTSRSNPLGGRSAWTGNSGGFITTAVNLPAAASGQTIQLRWRCGSDNRNSGTGWYVDTVAITSSSYACCTASADLGVSLTASPNPILAGQNLSYTLTVTSLGAFPASSVTITDALPASVTFVSASPGCVNLGGKVVCNLGTVPGGGSTNFTVVVTPTAIGLLTNTLTVASSTADSNLANNTATIVTAVNALPAVAVQPNGLEVIAGTNVTFQAAATGTAPLGYQWTFNNTALAGATAGTLLLIDVQPAQAGSYAVVVTNIAGSVTSSVISLTVLVPPAITTQPSNQTAVVGTSTSFSVTATGTASLVYQWAFDGTNLAGVTADTLLLTNVQPNQAGSYIVLITNAAGFVTSSVASLIVLVPPAITTQPSNQTAVMGTTAGFSVTATGTASLVYQWAFDGTNLAGATADTLLLPNVQPNQAGNYLVLITNAAGSVTSSVASLIVAPAGATISISLSARTGVSITFPSVAGLSYVLDYKNSLDDPTWTPLPPATTATGSVMVLQDTNNPTASRYYRVRRE